MQRTTLLSELGGGHRTNDLRTAGSLDGALGIVRGRHEGATKDVSNGSSSTS